MKPILVFQIIASNPRDNSSDVADIKSAIETKGGICHVTNIVDDKYDEVSLIDGVECVLSVGGDGTLIAIAQQIVDSGVPILGVNRGHLGYLCDLDMSSVYDAIPVLMSGEYDIEERMMLEGYVKRADGTQTKSIRALNDIVVSSLNGLQVINLSVYVRDEFLYSFNGDGMIFATPTGSTAYNLSANGPIVDPKTDVILMTPINPHTLNSRSIVIDRRDEISLCVTPRRAEESECIAASYDGGNTEKLYPGDFIVVSRAKSRVKMIHLSQMSFLERIRRKMMME